MTSRKFLAAKMIKKEASTITEIYFIHPNNHFILFATGKALISKYVYLFPISGVSKKGVMFTQPHKSLGAI